MELTFFPKFFPEDNTFHPIVGTRALRHSTNYNTADTRQRKYEEEELEGKRGLTGLLGKTGGSAGQGMFAWRDTKVPW